jgi:hypothetical protein
VTPAAPKIDSRLIAAIELIDEPGRRYAETCRLVGAVAARLGLVKPSYEQVRVLVHASRRLGRLPTAGDVLLEIAFRARPPEDLHDLAAGIRPTRGSVRRATRGP